MLGLAGTFGEALYKGLRAAGYRLRRNGGVYMTVRDSDKGEIGPIAKKFNELGFAVYASRKTADVIRKYGVKVTDVDGLDEIRVLIADGKIDYIISTSAKGRDPQRASVRLRRLAVEHAIPCLTSLDTANAVADSIASLWNESCTELVDINNLREEKIRLDFVKMHTCGNDYIYFDCMEQPISNPEGLSIKFTDRHYGIGGDGTIIIVPSDKADAGMRMFNRDGSEGRLCANGLGCVAKYLYESGIVQTREMTIETLAGIRSVKLTTCDGLVIRAKTEIGQVKFDAASVPVTADGEIIGRKLTLAGDEYKVTCVSLGNPHCVIFDDDMGFDISKTDVESIGYAIEHDPVFPERTNVEFVHVIDDHTIIARVWERGSGETNACGTGACAAAAAAVETGRCRSGAITVYVKGGALVVGYENGEVSLTGSMKEVYRGSVEI